MIDFDGRSHGCLVPQFGDPVIVDSDYDDWKFVCLDGLSAVCARPYCHQTFKEWR